MKTPQQGTTSPGCKTPGVSKTVQYLASYLLSWGWNPGESLYLSFSLLPHILEAPEGQSLFRPVGGKRKALLLNEIANA